MRTSWKGRSRIYARRAQGATRFYLVNDFAIVAMQMVILNPDGPGSGSPALFLNAKGLTGKVLTFNYVETSVEKLKDFGSFALRAVFLFRRTMMKLQAQ